VIDITKSLGVNPRSVPLVFSGMVFPARGARGDPLSLIAPWEPVASPRWLPPRVYKAGHFCVITGRVEIPTAGIARWSKPIARIPKKCVPRDGNLIFSVNQGSQTLTVEITQRGQLRHIAGTPKESWISLQGIAYFIEMASQPLPLAPKWKRTARFRVPSFKRAGNLCSLSGVARGGPDNLIAVVPRECRPVAAIQFNVNHNKFTQVVTVGSDGTITWSGKREWPFVRLDGVHYVVDAFSHYSPPDPRNLEGLPTSALLTPLPLYQPLTIDQRAAASKPIKITPVQIPSLGINTVSVEMPKVAPQASPIVASSEYAAFQSPRFFVVNDICHLSGVISSTSTTDLQRFLLRLPHNCRPSRRLSFQIVSRSFESTRVDVLPNGIVKYVGGLANSHFLPLDGIQFVVRPSRVRRLEPAQHFTNTLFGYGRVGYAKKGDYCLLSGFAKAVHFRERKRVCRWVKPNPNLRTIISKETMARRKVCSMKWVADSMWLHRRFLTTLPPECRPLEGHITFNLGSHVIDIKKNGAVEWINNKKSVTHISLDGIGFFTEVRDLLPMGKTWAAYSVIEGSCRRPSWKRQGSICALTGLVHGVDSSKNQRVVTRLPALCRPEKNLLFHLVDEHENLNRFIVGSNGDVIWVDGPGKGWISLDAFASSSSTNCRHDND